MSSCTNYQSEREVGHAVKLAPINTDLTQRRIDKHVPYQELPFKCTYQWCQHRFASVKEMKHHKKYDPEHFYCRKCDIDCADWEELTTHKVETMAPYVEGQIKATEENMPSHIVCEFCGEDFKSFGGRKIHRARMHQAEQNVECQGCKAIFIRAARMIDHFEQGHCPNISKHDFLASVQHKYVNKQIMERHPERIAKSLASNKLTGKDEPGLIGSLAEEQGGVSLLDSDSRSYLTTFEALTPQVDQDDNAIRSIPAKSEKWPRLPTKDTSGLNASMASISMHDNLNLVNKHIITQLQPSNDTARDGAWRSQSSSRKLFPVASPTPSAGDWDSILADRKCTLARGDRSSPVDNGNHLLKTRWWDPEAKSYNTNRFFNPLIQRYCCPFPDCYEDGLEFDIPADIASHIEDVHMQQILRCDSCFKRFMTVARLVAHVESTSNCSIRASVGFKQFLDGISGGFLYARDNPVPSICRPSNALVRASQPMFGVQPLKYVGKMPDFC